MASSAEMILGGALGDSKRMGLLARRMRVEHFPVDLQPVFTVMLRYHQVTGGVISGAQFRDQLVRSGADPAAREALERRFFLVAQVPHIEEDKWRWLMHQAVQDRQAELLVDSLSEAMRVLTEGVVDRRGERKYGYGDARRVLAERFGLMDRLVSEQTPDGNIFDEAKEVLAEYQAAKSSGIHLGVPTGLTGLDALTYGAQPGEFWLVAAYAGEGKTQTLVNIAYAAVEAGKNVVFFTLETLRSQVRRRFYIRHAASDAFARFGVQVGYHALKGGTLQPDEEEMFTEVVRDFQDRSSGRGRLELVWAPRGSTASFIAMRADVYEALFPVDMVIVDYAGLMGPGRRVDRQEGLVEILQALKGVATGHGSGKGVPLISAYQTSRHKRDEARKDGGYTLDSLAETAEAERSADLVMTLLRQHEDDRELLAQVLKYRDGESGSQFYLDVDFDRSLVRDRGDLGGSDDSGLDGLI